MKRLALIILPAMIFSVIYLAGCTSGESVAGDATETGTVVTGAVVDRSGNNEEGVVVTLVPQSFNGITDDYLQNSYQDTTREDGTFQIEIPVDSALDGSTLTYTLEALQPGNGNRFINTKLDVSLAYDKSVDAGTLTVNIPGSLRIQLAPAVEQGCWFFIPNTSLAHRVSGEDVLAGFALFDDIPAGLYDSLLYTSNGDATETIRAFGVFEVINGETLEIPANSNFAEMWPHDGAFGPGTRHFTVYNRLASLLIFHIGTDSFNINPGDSLLYEAPGDWSAQRAWGYFAGGEAGPHSLAQFSLGAVDFYNISLVDGFNLPLKMYPAQNTFFARDAENSFSCSQTECRANLLTDCPADLQQLDTTGVVTSCASACSEFDTDQYCCRNEFGQPETCITGDWPVNYAAYFKGGCPDAISLAFDNLTTNFICNTDPLTGFGPDYIIEFGY